MRRGLLIPVDSFSVVLRDAVAVRVEGSKGGLCGGNSLRGGLSILVNGFRVVLRDAEAVAVEETEVVFRIDGAPLRRHFYTSKWP